MPIDEQAKLNDASLAITHVKVSEIHIDHEFNCRGAFSPMECTDLAADIAKRGLQLPVTLRPLREEDRGSQHNEQVLIKQGYRYKAISGHRRITAYKINKEETIPAILKDAYIDDFEAKDLNAIENLQRKELTLWQEAQAIRHYWIADWNREDIGHRIGKSPGWVQIRFMLLEMEPEIQELANMDLLKQNDIRALSQVHDRVERLKTAALIRDQRREGKKGMNINLGRKPKIKASTKRQRLRSDIFSFLHIVQGTMKDANLEDLTVEAKILLSQQGNSFATRCLGWAAGEVSNLEVHMELRNFASVFGINYVLPEFEE